MSLTESMREVLTQFRLPGEAQQIDRIMEKFAARFFQTQPKDFSTQDCVHTLSFSIIMLNTDRHNPNIPESEKMSLEAFVANNRGINDGKDLPRMTLQKLYEDIDQNEIRMSGEKCGWLEREKHGSRKNWAKAWFVLKEHVRLPPPAPPPATSPLN